MIELTHTPPHGGGLMPEVTVGALHMPVYGIAMVAAITAGIIVYRINARRAGIQPGESLPVVLAALIGGTLGAKLPLWLMNLPAVFRGEWNWAMFFQGRTIAGAFVGGMLAVWIVKRFSGIKSRYGNLIAPSVALGMAIGRVGCLLTGCCYGCESSLPWAIDLGDHAYRHPTQIYEIVFCLAAFVFMQKKVLTAKPGRLFFGFFAAYFVFRFFEEFLRENPTVVGLTPFQWICLLGLGLLAVRTWMMASPPETTNHLENIGESNEYGT